MACLVGWECQPGHHPELHQSRHLPLGADTVSDKGADAEGGGAEFTGAASGGNTLSCFLHLNFFR